MAEFLLTVAGVERDLRLESLSVQHVVNGPDILEGDIQDEDGTVALSLDDVVVLTQTDVSPNTVYFEGVLQTAKSRTWTGEGSGRLRRITAFDYSVYAQWATTTLTLTGSSPADTVGSLIDTLVAGPLADYSVTVHPSQATGPTLEANAFDGQTVEAILNAVSEQTGWVWKIDASKRLRMWDPAAEAASYNVTATNETYVGDLTTEQMRQRYYNRVFVEGGNGYHTITDEQHFGDGSKTTFEMNAPMHYFEVDYTATLGFAVGLTILVTRGAVTTVEYANDAETAQWTFDPGPNYALRQVSGAVLGATEYFVIPGYAAQYPMRIVADGRGSPAAPPRDLTLVRPLVFGRGALQTIADATLTASQVDFERVVYPSDLVDLRPGQSQTITVAEAGLNDSYTCVSARLFYVSGGDTSAFRLEATLVNAVTARSFWLNLYDRWLTDNQGAGSSTTLTGPAGSVVPIGPAGLDQEVQSNGQGSFAADASFKHDRTAKAVTVNDDDATVIVRGLDGGSNYGPEAIPSALVALAKHDSILAAAFGHTTPGAAEALTVRCMANKAVLLQHTGSLSPLNGLSLITGSQLSLVGKYVIVQPESVASGDYYGHLKHFWQHDARAVRRIRVTTTTYTIDNEAAGGGGLYGAWIIDPTAACTVTLPSVSAFMGLPTSGYGRVLEIRNDSTQYVVTLDGSSSELIFRTGTGRLTFPLMPGASIKLIAKDSTGAGWKVLAYDLPPMEVTLTDAQIKALPTTPITLINAPPSGFWLKLLGGSLSLDASAGAYTNIDATYAACAVYWLGDFTQWAAAGPIDDTTYTLTRFTNSFGTASDKIVNLSPYLDTPSDGASGTLWTLPNNLSTANVNGIALAIAMDNNGTGNLTGGNAANTLKVSLNYSVEVI